MFERRRWMAVVGVLAIFTTLAAIPAQARNGDRFFNRIAHFPVYLNSDVANSTVAEIIDATPDGRTLIYSDAILGVIGFIDISDPASPQPSGTVDVGGSPTSVAVAGKHALVAVDTSTSFVSPSGHLLVIDLSTRNEIARFELGGQPDSIKVSADRRFAAIVIENQRDEDVVVDDVEGGLPQAPPGSLLVLSLQGNVGRWTIRSVDLTGLAAYGSEDPEPEFVDINQQNLAVVTLQENNHLVLVDLSKALVVRHFTAGDATVDGVDTAEDGLISFTDSIAVPREPDAVAWIDDQHFATANEGDLFGGSRGFTVYDVRGQIEFDSENTFDVLAGLHGHYPDGRSDAKGSEPEGVEFGRFGGSDYLFIGSERGSFVGVYNAANPSRPVLHQVLPAGWGPEGMVVIPNRNLLVVTSEEDDAPSGIRAVVSIYRYESSEPAYPNIVSDSQPWGALSGLAADPGDAGTLFAVWDSAFAEARILTIDASSTPAVITGSLLIEDSLDLDLDLEGVAVAPDGTFWVASEGNASDSRPNRLLQIAADGSVLSQVGLPDEVVACRSASTNRVTLGSGFEGLTIVGGPTDYSIYVAQQRGWDFTTAECEALDDDPSDTNPVEPALTRIWSYDPSGLDWSSFPYELEPVPPLASWIGLSEITALPDGSFVVIERDNLTGAFSSFKAAVRVDLSDGSALQAEKEIVDVLAPLRSANGWIHDKLEGLAVSASGQIFVVTDNDGVDDSSGETQFLDLGNWQSLFGS